MSTIKLGYARTDITPAESVPLAGFGNSSVRMHTNVMDPLYATCLAFSDEDGETALIYTMDLCGFYNAFADHIRDGLCEATGVRADRILASCTHNHSSPDLSNAEEDSIPRYIEYLKDQMIAAAQAALADRKPAKAQIGRIHTQGMNFVRRYVLQDGTYCGDNYGHPKESPYACHESYVDNCLQLMKFTRVGGKDVVIANFQMHPHRLGGYRDPNVTADVVGAFRAAYEAQADCCFAYFTGGSGNVNGQSRIKQEEVVFDHISHGKRLADYAMQVSFHAAKLGKLKSAFKNHRAPINHDDDHLLPQAEEICKVWTETKDKLLCKPLLDKYGFNSVYRATALKSRVTMGEYMDIPLWSVSMGDIAFAAAPYEMFDTSGQLIKDASPFRMTFIMTLTNEGGYGYMPSRLAFAHGGYSVDTCRFYPGIAEALAQSHIDLLESMAD